MSKVSFHVSEIWPKPHEDEEEALRGFDIPENPEEEMFLITRSTFKDIMAKALEDQKNISEATSVAAIKAAFTKGVKHISEIQNQLEIA